MDNVTQQNAALVEESAAAATALAEQATLLSESVAVFRLTRNNTAMPIVAARPSLLFRYQINGLYPHLWVMQRITGRRFNPDVVTGYPSGWCR